MKCVLLVKKRLIAISHFPGSALAMMALARGADTMMAKAEIRLFI